MHPLAADDLILEIAADRARGRQPSDVGGGLFRADGVAALEVDGHGDADGGDDAPGMGQRLLQRHVLAVLGSIGARHRCARH